MYPDLNDRIVKLPPLKCRRLSRVPSLLKWTKLHSGERLHRGMIFFLCNNRQNYRSCKNIWRNYILRFFFPLDLGVKKAARKSWLFPKVLAFLLQIQIGRRFFFHFGRKLKINFFGHLFYTEAKEISNIELWWGRRTIWLPRGKKTISLWLPAGWEPHEPLVG